MPTVCSNCGGTDIEYDGARGDAVCTGCGSVLEDNIIVSEVSFQEQSSGSSTLVGQFVSNEGGSGSRGPLVGSGFHHGLGRDSREVTLQQAKKRLAHLGNLLKLNQHCIDTAFGFFKMALQLNLTRGRKSSIMDTACLYLVCRSEGTPHMLLDFSDVLQINVYSLGRAYLKLSTALHINPPAIDPCLYIHRFAHKLELGDKVHDVSMTALRLVARMKRDWIHHGRRPAGLCGASLLVSARLHNFNRTVKEVARVVKLSEGTIRKRLGDFKDTPSSRLSIDEFLKIDLEQEHDPPCFLEAKKKAKNKTTEPEEDSEEEEGGDSVEKEAGQEDNEEASSSGFGGIKVSSVEEIISKARTAEAFLNVPNAALSGSLTELAELVEGNSPENTTGVVNEREGPSSDQSLGSHGELELEDISDGEIEQMLLSEEEVKIKTKLWFAENADYLKELEVKRERQAILLAEKGSKPKKKPVRRKKKESYATPASTAGEAIERMLVEKKISSKINYDVLRDLDKDWLGGGGGSKDGVESTSIATASDSETRITSSSRNDAAVSPSGTSRLPSLRKRNMPSLTARHTAKFMRIEEEDNSSMEKRKDLLTTSGDILASERSKLKDSLTEGVGPSGEGAESGEEPCSEVVEETGPIQYDDEGAGPGEDEWGGDLEDMVYEGDPLLNSDYEDADDGF